MLASTSRRLRTSGTTTATPSSGRPPRRPGRRPPCLRWHRCIARVACLAAAVLPPAVVAAAPPPLQDTGVAVAPADAAFFTATLRAREQVDLLVGSRAWASLLELPVVKRALDSLDEQRTTPGSPLALVDTLMQLPENADALALLSDMVATDTFLYGEPSCISFVQLTTKLQQAFRPAFGGERIEFDVELDLDTRAAPPARIQPVALQVAEAELSPEELQARLVLSTLAENIDLLVVPDLVWGFHTTQADTARQQLKRIEVFASLATQASPDLAEALERKEIAGGEFVTFTLEADSLPLAALAREIAGDVADTPEADAVLERLGELRLVIALGVVGDRVVLSIGDSTDHLAKLVAPAAAAGSLYQTEPLAPLRAAAQERITGISYLSAEMAKAIAAGQVDLGPMLDSIGEAARKGDLSEEAVADVQQWLAGAAEWYAARLPVPGPWLAYSFLTAEGYEGFVWDWATNQPLDASRQLGLVEHAGGAPLAVAVTRAKQDPRLVDDLRTFATRGWEIFQQHALPSIDEDERERVEAAVDTFGPLAGRLLEVLRDTIVPAIGDGQVGLVFDAKTRVTKLHRELPSSAEPLPLPEAAIVLPLADRARFVEGLNDLFALTDELVAAARALDPDAVPADYRVPDPVQASVDAGRMWSFPMPRSGVDDQVQPTIGVGERAVVFALVPKHAARLLGPTRLETGASLSRFDTPLSTAAAVDVAGLLDALGPWIAYGARYASVAERQGEVDADEELAADDENEQAREVLQHVDTVLEALKCLRTAVAETAERDGALVTRWRNVIRDLPVE